MKIMKCYCILQVRSGSTRLPGKAMLFVDEKLTLLEYVISQLKHSKLLDGIIMATTNLPEDDKLIDTAKNENILFFRGSSEDVLKRFNDCAESFSVSTIVRITADNPLIDPTLIDNAIKKFNLKSYDYVTNTLERTFPYGTEVEIFSIEALKYANKFAKKKSEREHVTPFFYNNQKKFKIFIMKNTHDFSHLRWTVDHRNDLELVRQIVKKIKKRPILTSDILQLYKKEPEIFSLNKENIPNEGYLKSQKED